MCYGPKFLFFILRHILFCILFPRYFPSFFSSYFVSCFASLFHDICLVGVIYMSSRRLRNTLLRHILFCIMFCILFPRYFPSFFISYFVSMHQSIFLRHEIDSSMLQQSCNVQFFQLTSSIGAPSAVRFFSIYFLIPFLIAQC